MSKTLIRILMVTDDEGSYLSDQRFGLTEVIKALEEANLSYVRFEVTKAHRGSSTEFQGKFVNSADKAQFRFTPEFNLNPFDEVWFFGVASSLDSTRHPLDTQELKILSQFMNAGGGVFATGDHEDLGGPLCGMIPRVRSMRRWNFDHNKYKITDLSTYNAYDESAGDAPPLFGPHRHDTLVEGDQGYQFDDQSDDIPQHILVKKYTWGGDKLKISMPHPLLCSHQGVINVLPDHMHEGECETPDKVDEMITFDNLTFPEYPTGSHGVRVLPEVIAWGSTTAGHNTRLEKKDSMHGTLGQSEEDTAFKGGDTPVIGDTFGCIGVYDGHYAGDGATTNVGRVVVDATFHHFFNINISGAGSNSTNPVKQQGFYGSAEGLFVLEKIRNYWKNIAIWLASPAKQQQMFDHVLEMARWDSQLRMSRFHADPNNVSWRDLVGYGRFGRQALVRLSSPCLTVQWTARAIDPRALLLSDKIYVLLTLPDPPPEPYLRPMLGTDEVLSAAIGSLIAEMVRADPSGELALAGKLRERLPAIRKHATKKTLLSATRVLTERIRNSEKLNEKLREAAAQIHTSDKLADTTASVDRLPS